MATLVEESGFQANLPSCFILLVCAITAAHGIDASEESGLAQFQWAMHLRGRLGAQLSLEYVQVLILSTLFLLKKGRLLQFCLELQVTSTVLHAVIKR
jgi:hypothetical protein